MSVYSILPFIFDNRICFRWFVAILFDEKEFGKCEIPTLISSDYVK